DLAALERDARRSAELFDELGDAWGVLRGTDWLIGLADQSGDHAEAMRLCRDGLRLAEELGLWPDVAGRLGWLAWLSARTGDVAGAREYGERARRLAARQGLHQEEVLARLALAVAARRAGDPAEAEGHLRGLLDAARRRDGEGPPPYLAMVLAELGLLAVGRGDAAGALDRFREGFAVARELGSVPEMAWALVGMAAALVPDGRPRLAALLLGAAEAARRAAGQRLAARDRDDLARITAAVEAAAPGFPELFAAGMRLTPEQARDLLDAPGPAASAAGPSGLGAPGPAAPA